MDTFDILTLIGGLAMFLFGMNVMETGLEKRAGGKLKGILGSMTSNPLKGFTLGFLVTAAIQSSSATTVMVIGFVNSGIMTLRQAIGVIMGANLGTSVTSWILSLAGIESGNFFIKMFKPSSFVPVLALIGIIYYMFQKNAKRKDTGLIFLGFAVLMTGMETMADAVSGLIDVPGFSDLLLLFSNPIFGVLVGAVLTAIIQSSSASVGILQTLSMTGAITYSTAIPIIMGQNIGTCVTAMISSIGASKDAKRIAFVHLSFNVLSSLILLPIYYVVNIVFKLGFENLIASPFVIAIIHTVFNLLALVIMMPCSKLLEKLACFFVRDAETKENVEMLDERFMATPSIAIERCKNVSITMAEISVKTIKDAFSLISSYDPKLADKIIEKEDLVDTYEDKLGTYLVKLSSHDMTEADSNEANKLLHLIGDFERISDHAVNVLKSVQEINDKKLEFSGDAKKELSILVSAVTEILDLSLASFKDGNLDSAVMVEPLEQVVDYLRDYLKKRHIHRLQKGSCTIELGFVLTDLLTNLERISDHCSNIAGCVLEMSHENLDIHEYLRSVKGGEIKEFNDYYDYFKVKYDIKNKMAVK